MAKKKGESKVQGVADPAPEVENTPAKARGGLKAVRLDLPAEVHRALRLVAAHEGVSMASYARDALATLLAEEMRRRKLNG